MTVVLNSALLILMLEYTSVFAGVGAAPQHGPVVVGMTLREFYILKLAYYYNTYNYYFFYYYS
jgi:hypothetical protein